jgi:hypothetical protein
MPLMFLWVLLLRRRWKASARYEGLPAPTPRSGFRDDAAESAFAILAKLSHACGSENPHEALSASGIPASERAPLQPDTRGVPGLPRQFGKFRPIVGPSGAYCTRACGIYGLSIVRALRKIPPGQATMEYGQITTAAAAHAAGNWYKRNAGQQMLIFIRGGHPETGRASATWRESCEGHP